MSILVLDDEEYVRNLVSQILSINGYACMLAGDAVEAREHLSKQSFDLVLCDVNLPGESGIDFIRYARAEYPDTAVVMVSGVDDPEMARTALEIGAYGYIIKPFEPEELIINISNALMRRKLEIQNRLHRENLEQMVADRTAELQEALAKLRKSMEGIIQAMSMTVESRDPYTAGHQHRVANLAHAIGKEVELSEERLEGVWMAGMIHDLGKISVPAEILAKPGKLNEMEFSIIKNHAQVGFDILKNIDFPWPIAQMVLQHHERIDGSGYPQGLAGDDILWESKILGVADVVEAMASHRPYRPALGIEKALEEISNKANIFYPSDVVEACITLFKKRQFTLSS